MTPPSRLHPRLPRASRRAALLAIGALLVSCTPSAPRCKTCGMKIDPASAWRTELVGPAGEVMAAFDSPRCAFQAWRSGKVQAASLRVPDYYDRQPRMDSELRFVIGGDVVGPMGPDLVPVEPSRAAKFVQDHGAERALRASEVTAETLAQLK